MDIPDIAFVVQFGVPSSLSVWIQRAGRAGHSRDVQATATLLVERSVMEPLTRRTEGEDSSMSESENEENERAPRTYRKNTEDGLRRLIETRGCRRDVIDEYFNNPPTRQRMYTTSPHVLYLIFSPAPLGRCCDNCTPTMPTPAPDCPSRPSTPRQDSSQQYDLPCTPSKSVNTSGKRPMAAQDPATRSRRTGQHLADIRTALQQWRVQARHRDFPHSIITGTVLLPDSALASIASSCALCSVDAIKTTLRPPWMFVDEYGNEVVSVISQIDEHEKIACVQAEQEKHDNKRRAVEAARAKKASEAQERHLQRAAVKLTRQAAKENFDR